MITRKELMKKKRLKKFFVFFTIIGSIFILSFSIYKVVYWFIDNKNTNDQTLNILNDVTINESNSDSELINKPDSQFDPYWDYIKIPLISVDFKDLISKNSDTVGWIQVNNTNINYPVVKYNNNKFYLNHGFDKKWNDAGWIFMDYRNNNMIFDKNTVIYGHSRIDKSMFGSLRWLLKQKWLENNDNYIIKFSTPEENTMWQIFSVYTVKNEDYYINTSFSNEEEYHKWLTTVSSRSIYNFNTKVNSKDKVITLSSCYNSDGSIKIAVHAKLIKREIRQ